MSSAELDGLFDDDPVAMQRQLQELRAELALEVERRTAAEEKLQRSDEDFRFLFQRGPLAMWLYNPHTRRFVEVNEAAMALYGYSREEFLAMDLEEIHAPAMREKLDAAVADAQSRDFMQTQNWKHVRKDGRVIEVDTYSRRLSVGHAAVRLVVAIDVTGRTEAESQLRQAQKMEAMGQLTGGVAHDFNNLLSIIMTNLELILDECGAEPTSVRAMADAALASVQRGAQLTQRLLAFARQQPLEPRVVDMRSMVEDMAMLLRRSLGEGIRVEQKVEANLWMTRVDPSQLENALLNLAVNARDAMPGGGTLRVSARNVVAKERSTRISARRLPVGEYVMVKVVDSGAGMPKEVRDKAVEPFFTTKPVGKGTGLGLSMVYGFIRQSGGQMAIESETGVGTTIRLYLPRTTADGEKVASVSADVERSARGETVLLVEDDATIRVLVKRLLEQMGYRALAAANGMEALEMLAVLPRVDLLLTDVVLPDGMSGVTLAQVAQRGKDGLRVLLMSGYTRQALPGGEVGESMHLLQKPFRREELAKAVAGALARKEF